MFQIFYQEKVYTTQPQKYHPQSFVIALARFNALTFASQWSRIVFLDTPNLLSRMPRNPYIPFRLDVAEHS